MAKNSILRLFITGLFTICLSTFANAYSSSYYTTSSKLAEGKWVKIKVDNVGIHQITYNQLREMGFSNPENVSVYGYGGAFLGSTFDTTLPDDLPAQPIYRSNDKILFYAEGDVRFNVGSDTYKASIKRNTYSTAGYYFLSDYNPGESNQPTSYSYYKNTSETRTTHNCIQVIEYEKICPSMGSYRFFGPEFKEQPIQEFSFKAPDADVSSIGQFSYYWGAKTSTSFALNFQTSDFEKVYESHPTISYIISGSTKYYYDKNGYINLKMKEDNDFEYKFTASFPSNINTTICDFAAIDYASFIYYRYNNIANLPQLRMVFANVSSTTEFSINGANENTLVWNVSSPINVFAHETEFDNTTGTLKGSFDKKYSPYSNGHAYLIAFDPTQEQYPVEYVGEVANQNIHSLISPDMLIITNKIMQPYANELAEAHKKYQNMTVYVINQEDIFNEFSSGTPSAMAYRRLAKMFYDRSKTKFKYLLLYGAGSYDNRGLIYNNDGDLLTYECETSNEAKDMAQNYCADSYFGMLDDSFTLNRIQYTPMDIAVSRIPADRTDKAENTNSKIIDYLKNPPVNISQNRALLMCDDGDCNAHLKQSEALSDTIMKYAPYITITKAYNALYPWTDGDAKTARAIITQSLANGQHYMCYTGHGRADCFTSEDLWSRNYINSTNYNISPITFLATCDALSFDRKDNGMAENMLYKRNGGSIAIVAASRTVYKDYNQHMSTAFARQIFTAQSGDCIGDIYRKAHNEVTREASELSDNFYGANNMCYNMIGDPALPINTTTDLIATTKINGQTCSLSDKTTKYNVFPLADNNISGYIINSDNTIESAFNGKITLSIYETPIDVETFWRETNDTTKVINRDEDIILETTVPVKSGAFSANLTIPTPLRPGGTNRISYFAVSDDLKKSAQGEFNQMVVMNYDASQAIEDTTAPEISEMYIDNPTFNNNDIVGNEIIVYATILPDASGLCSSASNIGSSAKLTLDGSKSYPEVKGMLITDADGITTLKFPISELADGHHTLTLSVADNSGNRSDKAITFYVINNSVKSAIIVAERPARTEATISISHNFNEEPSGRLIIEDNQGNTIFSQENCSFPYTWDLKDTDGNLVEDGTYNCYSILNAGKQYSSTSKVKIIVVKQ